MENESSLIKLFSYGFPAICMIMIYSYWQEAGILNIHVFIFLLIWAFVTEMVGERLNKFLQNEFKKYSNLNSQVINPQMQESKTENRILNKSYPSIHQNLIFEDISRIVKIFLYEQPYFGNVQINKSGKKLLINIWKNVIDNFKSDLNNSEIQDESLKDIYSFPPKSISLPFNELEYNYAFTVFHEYTWNFESDINYSLVVESAKGLLAYIKDNPEIIKTDKTGTLLKRLKKHGSNAMIKNKTGDFIKEFKVSRYKVKANEQFKLSWSLSNKVPKIFIKNIGEINSNETEISLSLSNKYYGNKVNFEIYLLDERQNVIDFENCYINFLSNSELSKEKHRNKVISRDSPST